MCWLHYCNMLIISMCVNLFLNIVGYMVGLGDRHVQNILIDTNTAEFIHIDLGKLGSACSMYLICL